MGALTRPPSWGHLIGVRSTPQIHLVQTGIFLLLIPNVLAYHRLVSSHRRHKIPSCPEVLSNKTSLPLTIHPAQIYRALALDVPYHLRYRILRGYRYQHVHMIQHQVPFLYPALLLTSQLPQYFSKVLPQLFVQHFSSTLGNKYHMVFALPLRVTLGFHIRPSRSPSRVLGGSQVGVSLMDSRICQTSTASPAEPGELSYLLRRV